MDANDYLLLAGKNLIEQSALAKWEADEMEFRATQKGDFEEFHKNHGEFGRVICWILFSVGAEYLLKAACVAHGVFRPKMKALPLRYPNLGEPLDSWVADVLLKKDPEEAVSYPEYGTLHAYYEGPGKGRLTLLKDKVGLSDSDYCLHYAGFKLMATAIRNRDIHSYVRNVRHDNFYLIEQVFVPCLNVLAQSLPDSVKPLLRDS